MTSLNYRHLYYFWSVVREGSITRATRVLHLTQPAISAQIQKLERSLGEELFARSGRTLVLTEVGQTVYRYADEIFSLGREMTDVVRGGLAGRPMRLAVGVSNGMPKLVAYRLLAPALGLDPPARLVLRDDRPERLLADLAIHDVDLVLTDAPLTPGMSVRAYSHLLGESGITIFGTEALRARYGADFPRSLDGAPFLVPTDDSTLRRSLDQWFQDNDILPTFVGEIEDSALLKVFGQAGAGCFAAPSVVEAEVRGQYRVEVLGRIDSVRERFYAISTERRLKHPAVVAISEAARKEFFAQEGD
jgi:LysR family transcriptional regulator, transcriptional activator of nhaA